MTREEAIKTLKGEAWISCSEKWNEALELAIKALENPERNVIAVMPCGNCIDRQAAIDELKRISFSYWFECGDYISEDTREIEIINSDKALEVIEALPSVTPAEKVGRWEWVQYDGNPNIGNWHCSECGSIFIEGTIKKEKDSIPFYKYCPSCGAKLEEGD